MKKPTYSFLIFSILIFQLLFSACQPSPTTSQTNSGKLKVLAVENFLADIAQNVAGNRLVIESLIPIGVDPHSFEPTPQDVARIATSQILVINGAGVESWLQPVLQNAGGNRVVVTASDGLSFRTPKSGEIPSTDNPGGGDPHFWLDPISVVQYVRNIQKALTDSDPSGADAYQKNADAYIAQLQSLDAWIRTQVAPIPVNRRLLVTNHESLGYFADRYGFEVVGAIIPSFSTDASPSAQDLASLTASIRKTGALAIFLDTGSNPQLAQQIASETGIRVVTDIYSHSITAAGGPAPTYIDMMRHNTLSIVAALMNK